MHLLTCTLTHAPPPQLDAASSNLNSNDAFILVTPGGSFLWMGVGASDAEKHGAQQMCDILGVSASELSEGGETGEGRRITRVCVCVIHIKTRRLWLRHPLRCHHSSRRNWKLNYFTRCTTFSDAAVSRHALDSVTFGTFYPFKVQNNGEMCNCRPHRRVLGGSGRKGGLSHFHPTQGQDGRSPTATLRLLQ